MGIAAERRAIESTYTDICTVYNFENVKEGSKTRPKKILLYEGKPCALSQKSSRPTGQTETVNVVSYDAKLFIAPELVIEPGSHIEVSRIGRVFPFISSGEAFIYETHQEIMLLRKGKA